MLDNVLRHYDGMSISRLQLILNNMNHLGLRVQFDHVRSAFKGAMYLNYPETRTDQEIMVLKFQMLLDCVRETDILAVIERLIMMFYTETDWLDLDHLSPMPQKVRQDVTDVMFVRLQNNKKLTVADLHRIIGGPESCDNYDFNTFPPLRVHVLVAVATIGYGMILKDSVMNMVYQAIIDHILLAEHFKYCGTVGEYCDWPDTIVEAYIEILKINPRKTASFRDRLGLRFIDLLGWMCYDEDFCILFKMSTDLRSKHVITQELLDVYRNMGQGYDTMLDRIQDQTCGKAFSAFQYYLLRAEYLQDWVIQEFLMHGARPQELFEHVQKVEQREGYSPIFYNESKLKELAATILLQKKIRMYLARQHAQQLRMDPEMLFDITYRAIRLKQVGVHDVTIQQLSQ